MPVQALNLHRCIDEFSHLFIITALRTQVFLAFQCLGNSHRICRVCRYQLGNPVDQRIREFHDPPDIANGRPCLQRPEGDNLCHPVKAVFFLHIADHLVTAFLTEIDIKIRHGYAFRVQKPFKKQSPSQRIKICNRQCPRHNRPGARPAPRPHRDRLALCPLDEVRNNQEIAGKAHLVDHFKLECQTIIIGRGRLATFPLVHVGSEDMLVQPVSQPCLGLTFQFIRLAAACLAGEFRQNRCAHFGNNTAALRNDDSIPHSFWNIGKQCGHFCGRFEVMLGGIACAILFGDAPASPDADKHIMRHFHVTRLEPAIICCHQWQAGLQRQLQQQGFGPLFGRQTMALQFDIDAAWQYSFQRLQAICDKRILTISRSCANKTRHGTTAKQQHPIRMTRQIIHIDDRIITALNLKQCL